MDLTKTQKSILQRMDKGEELTWEKGGGWWIENDKTNGKLAYSFLRLCLISEDQFTESNEEYKRFHINGTGTEALKRGYANPII